MDGIDIGLFEHDRNNATYFYILNADETIYLRYGGRDEVAGDTYMNLESLELAMKLGLEQHAKHKEGLLPPQPRPEPFFPNQIPLLKKYEIDRGRCVECHLINDYVLQQKELDGTLDRRREMYRSPDVKRIGIHLDVPKGLVVAQTEGPAADAGMVSGDLIAAVDGTPVLTFGDLQHRYDKVDRNATRVVYTVWRGDAKLDLTIALPEEWWRTDLYFRFLTIEPQLYFTSRPLTDEEKTSLGLPIEGFASEITESNAGAQALRLHTLKQGDIVYAVDDVQTDPVTRDLEMYIRLNKRAGEYMTLSLVRGGERMTMEMRTERQYFRKQESDE